MEYHLWQAAYPISMLQALICPLTLVFSSLRHMCISEHCKRHPPLFGKIRSCGWLVPSVLKLINISVIKPMVGRDQESSIESCCGKVCCFA
jgi:hypothetical protein